MQESTSNFDESELTETLANLKLDLSSSKLDLERLNLRRVG